MRSQIFNAVQRIALGESRFCFHFGPRIHLHSMSGFPQRRHMFMAGSSFESSQYPLTSGTPLRLSAILPNDHFQSLSLQSTIAAVGYAIARLVLVVTSETTSSAPIQCRIIFKHPVAVDLPHCLFV